MAMNEIEEIKQRIDIVELVGQYVSIKKAGANYKAICPFHQEKTASFMVSPEKQIWKCFGCQKGGSIFDFVMEIESLEFGDALRLLAQKAGVQLQSKTQAEHQTKDRKETLYRLNNFTSFFFHKVLLERPEAKEARDYLEKRKISTEMIKQFRLGFASRRIELKKYLLQRSFNEDEISRAGSPERFFERIMFPIFDVLGNVIAFTGRIVKEGEPKYLNTPETALFNKGRILYALNFAKAAIKEKDYVILVEGQMDVIAFHQNGIKNAVASSGTALTETQLQILSKYTNNFLLAFDNDEAGRATTRKVIEMLLRLDLNCKVVDFSPYKDAGELFEDDAKKWVSRAKEAKEAVDYLIGLEVKKVGELNFIENKKKILKALLPILVLVEPSRLDHYIQRLSVYLELKSNVLYQAVERAGSRQTQPSAKQPESEGLNSEEQLLALLLEKPTFIEKYQSKLGKIQWQSVETAALAKAIKKLYTDKALSNKSQINSLLKTSLDSPTAQKIDSWHFWVQDQFEELTDDLADNLIQEKLEQVNRSQYEQKKDSLAFAIKRAQEEGSIQQVKELMAKLSDLTKERDG